MEVIQIICIEYRKDKLHLRKTKYYPSNFIKEIDFQIWVSIPINLNVTWPVEQTYLLGTGDLDRFLVIGSAFNLSSCGFRDLFWDVFVVGEGEATLTVADEVTVIGSARWDNRGELGADADWGFKTSWILGLWATGNCASCSCFFAPVLVLRWGWKYENWIWWKWGLEEFEYWSLRNILALFKWNTCTDVGAWGERYTEVSSSELSDEGAVVFFFLSAAGLNVCWYCEEGVALNSSSLSSFPSEKYFEH